jgi:hypothetical protein
VNPAGRRSWFDQGAASLARNGSRNGPRTTNHGVLSPVLRAACWVLRPVSALGKFVPRAGERTQHPLSTQHLVFALILLALGPNVFACAVCYGAPGDPMTEGMNRGIWVLLGIVFVVQAGFVALFWSFWRRAREQRRFRESLRVIEGGSHS